LWAFIGEVWVTSGCWIGCWLISDDTPGHAFGFILSRFRFNLIPVGSGFGSFCFKRGRQDALPSVEFLAECLGKGVGLRQLPGVPAFAVAGVAPGGIGAQRGECGVVGTPAEMDFHAVEPVVQPPGGGNGDCVSATIASAAEIGVGGIVAVMFVRPELQRGAAPWGGKFDFPTDCVGNATAEGFAGGDVFPERGRYGEIRASEVVAVATGVFFGFPLPVESLKFRTEGQRFAGEVFGLGLLADLQEQEIGAADRSVVIEVVHLRGGIVELEAKGDGHGAFRDGDPVGVGTAIQADEAPGGAANVWLNRQVVHRGRDCGAGNDRSGGGSVFGGSLEGIGVKAHTRKKPGCVFASGL